MTHSSQILATCRTTSPSLHGASEAGSGCWLMPGGLSGEGGFINPLVCDISPPHCPSVSFCCYRQTPPPPILLKSALIINILPWKFTQGRLSAASDTSEAAPHAVMSARARAGHPCDVCVWSGPGFPPPALPWPVVCSVWGGPGSLLCLFFLRLLKQRPLHTWRDTSRLSANTQPEGAVGTWVRCGQGG